MGLDGVDRLLASLVGINEDRFTVTLPPSGLGLLFLSCYAGRADQGAQHPRPIAQMVRFSEPREVKETEYRKASLKSQ